MDDEIPPSQIEDVKISPTLPRLPGRLNTPPSRPRSLPGTLQSPVASHGRFASVPNDGNQDHRSPIVTPGLNSGGIYNGAVGLSEGYYRSQHGEVEEERIFGFEEYNNTSTSFHDKEKSISIIHQEVISDETIHGSTVD
jgi:hypothetical protein